MPDVDQIAAVPRDPQEKGHGIAEVAHDQLDGQGRIVDVEIPPPPGEQAVGQGNQRDDTQQRGTHQAGDLDAQPGAVGKGMQGIGRPVVRLLIRGHHDGAGRERVAFGLGPSQLGGGQRRGDAHDARRDQGLRIDAHADERHQHGAGDRREPGTHDLVDLGPGEVGDEGLDQHGGLALADEGRRGGDDGLGAGHAHAPEEEDGELGDRPLDEVEVVQQLDERDEEDDRGDDADEEPAAVRGGKPVCHQEIGAVLREPQQQPRQRRHEVEDVVADLRAQHEHRDHELHQHAHHHRVPVDPAAIATRDPQGAQGHDESEQTDGAVGSRVVGRLGRHERPDQDHGDREQRGGRDA